MAGMTYSKFFWQDYASDVGLLKCSPAAQGLWMRLLCLASEATPVGHILMPDGSVPTVEDIHIVTRFPIEQIPVWLEEIKRNAVCDVTGRGIMISRKMVQQARKHKISVEGGKARQRQIAESIDENSGGSSRPAQPSGSATINHQPESISHQPSAIGAKPPPTFEENMSKVARLSKAIGFDVTTHPGGQKFIQQMIELEMQGIDFELDLLPTIQERRDASKIPRDLKALSYFREPAFAHKQAREMGAELERQRRERLEAPVPDEEWRVWVSRFVNIGGWHPERLGPDPTQEGCRAPSGMLDQARAAWDRQGQVPREDPAGAFKRPIPFWGSNVLVLRAAK
jgi:hypothetical protein